MNQHRILQNHAYVTKKSLDEWNDYHGLVQNLLTGETKEEDYTQWFKPKMDGFDEFLKDVEKWKNEQQAQLTVNPEDSVSNVTKHSKAKSSKSAASSVTAARLRAEAEKAALLVRASTLKAKQALELEQAKMQARLEQMELDISLAESDARIKIQLLCIICCLSTISCIINGIITKIPKIVILKCNLRII